MDDKSDKAASDSASTIRRRPPSVVVGIGASAGGLAAFRTFFDHMPADTGMAFVLVQHLDPNHKSMLVELLRPHTAMHVVDAEDQAPLVANQIHVIPPNATLTLEGDILRVTVPAPAREHRRPSIRFSRPLPRSRRLRCRHHLVGRRQRRIAGDQGDQGAWWLHARLRPSLTNR